MRAGPTIHSLSKRSVRQRRSPTGPSHITATARETPEKAAALAKRDPLMPFNRWNDMVDILERLNVTDPAVWTPQITRGFTYMGIMIEHTGIEGHPEIKRAIHRMFERMPQELVFANPRVTPAAKNSMPNIWASPT